jgi:MATE family multidrug resistance protein
MAELLRTGLPIGITVLMEGGLFIVTALLIGRLGATSAAAHQIAINVAQLCFMIPMGVAEATTVRVGHARRSRRCPWRAPGGRAGYAIIMGTQRCRRGAAVRPRCHRGAVHQRPGGGGVGLHAVAVRGHLPVPDGIQVLSAGALRGLKDTRVPMFIAMFAYWGLGMPLGAGLGLGLGWAQGMWIGLIVGLTAAAILMGCARSSRRLIAQATRRPSMTLAP